MGPTEKVLPEVGERIQSLKSCVLNKTRMGFKPGKIRTMDNFQKI
jgi:hypothetical protein